MLALALGGLYHGYLGAAEVRAPDAAHVCIVTPEPMADLLDLLVEIPIISPGAGAGTGPYRTVAQDESGIHLINLPPVAYVFQPSEPAGWVHATLERKGMKLELRCVDPAHKSHGQTVKLQWRAG